MAVCCTRLNGFARECLNPIGGIKYFGAICKDDIESVTFNETISCLIDTITLADGAAFVSYPIDRDLGGIEIAAFRTNGTKGWTTTVTAVISGMTAERNCELQKFMGDGTVILVIDSNDRRWLIGYDDAESDFGVTWTDGNAATTGSARTDQNGYTLVLEEITGHLPYEVSATAFETPVEGTDHNILGRKLPASVLAAYKNSANTPVSVEATGVTTKKASK